MATPITFWFKADANGVIHAYLTDPDAAPVPVPTPAPVPPPVPVPPVPVPAPVPARPQFRGSNLTGGGTSYDTWPAAGTGPVSGTHYLFVSNMTVDKLIAAGMNAFRVVFAWEALQPSEYADITKLVGAYQIYRDKLFSLVDYITSKGCTVILDIHGDKDAGFAAYRGSRVGGSTPTGQLVEDLLENVWWQLATKYKTNTRVFFGITNEPHDITPSAWFKCAQKVINGIRNAGNTQKIVMPGVDWDGAGTWAAHNASAWNLTDPANNLAVQVHLYFDANSGGGDTTIASRTIGVERLKGVTEWARSKKLEVILGEVGLSAANAQGEITWENTLAYINANKDVIGGFLWWATGEPAWWGNYQFTLLNSSGAPSAQLKMLTESGSFAP